MSRSSFLSVKSSLLLLLTLFASTSFAQAPPNNGTGGNSTTGGGNGTSNGNSTTGGGNSNQCNPFLSLCPGADCMSSANTGTYQVQSPNNSAFFFANQPINISWTFTAATNRDRYPANNVTIYIQKDGTREWTLWTAIGRGNTSLSAELPSRVPGTYRLRFLTDDIDNAGNGIGRQSSCVDDGFPTAGLSEKFTVLAPPPDLGPSFVDPFPPNDATSSATSTRQTQHQWVITAIVSLLFLSCIAL